MLVGLLVNRVFLIELLVGVLESETRISLLVCVMLLCGESDVPVGSVSGPSFVTLVSSP